MPEADHDFLVGHAPANVGLGFVRRVVTFLDLERHFVGAAVLGAAQRADGAGDAGIDVGTGAGNHARGERGRVEFVLGVEIERGVHGAHPARRWRPAMQQVQEVPGHRVVVGLDVDAATAVREVIPVAEHRSEARHQVIGDLARTRGVVIIGFGQHAAQRRRAGAHDVHGMRGRRQLLEDGAHGRRDAAQVLELGLVGGELLSVRQFAVDQQIGQLFELAGLGHFEDVVAAIVQVVAAAAHAAQRGVAGRDTGERHGFLRFAWLRVGRAHFFSFSARFQTRTAHRASVRRRDSRETCRGRRASAWARRRSSACRRGGWLRSTFERRQVHGAIGRTAMQHDVDADAAELFARI